MDRLYKTQWANGMCFDVFTNNSQIEIRGSIPYTDDDLHVSFVNTSLGPGLVKVKAVSNDGYTIEIDLNQELGHGFRAVAVEWFDEISRKTTLIGEIFIGDPNGAGGFGGEQDSGGVADLDS